MPSLLHEAWVEGSEDDASERLGYGQTFYDELTNPEENLCTVGARGLPTYTRSQLVTRDLNGDPLAAVWLPGGVTSYNDQGLVTESWGGVEPGATASALRHATRTYDPYYGAFAVTESIQANRVLSANPLDSKNLLNRGHPRGVALAQP